MRNIIALLVCVMVLSACSAPSSDPAMPPTPTAELNAPLGVSETPSLQAPAVSGANPTAVISCEQLIPSQELSNLLLNAQSTLVENTYPGTSSCEWEYIPKDGTQANLFYLQVDFTGDPSMWEATRNSELSNEPSDIVVNSIDGLADENYTWRSSVTGQQVVYARQGSNTLIFRYNPQDLLFMGTESGIIDMAQRIFERML